MYELMVYYNNNKVESSSNLNYSSLRTLLKQSKRNRYVQQDSLYFILRPAITIGNLVFGTCQHFNQSSAKNCTAVNQGLIILSFAKFKKT